MQDIADRLNITKVSVSKAYNNQPGISDELRERIFEVGRQIGYDKAPKRSDDVHYTFAYLCPKRFFLTDESFYTTIYYYINKFCTARNFDLQCFVINDSEEQSCEIPSQLQKNMVDGLFVGGELTNDYLQKLDKLSMQKVSIDFFHNDLNMDGIVIDNFNTSFEVTNYLIAQGHRSIGFVGNIYDTFSICDRYLGYTKSLLLHRLPLRDDWHLVNNNFSGVYTTDFQLPEEMPSAFVCHCDKAAYTLIQRLEYCGFHVPERVSVISFDNTNLCNIITPKLTSVNTNLREVSERSVEQMLFKLKHPDMSRQKIYLPSELILRDSVRKLET